MNDTISLLINTGEHLNSTHAAGAAGLAPFAMERQGALFTRAREEASTSAGERRPRRTSYTQNIAHL